MVNGNNGNLYLQYFQVETVSTDLTYRKGSISVRLFYKEISMVFVGAHLAAHDEFYEKRIKDYRQIIENTRFSDLSRDGILDQE